MNIRAGLIRDMVSLSQDDITAYETSEGVFYHIGCLFDAVTFAANECRYLRLEISTPPVSSTGNVSSGLAGLSSRINTMRTGVTENVGKTILTKYLPIDLILKNSEYSSLKAGKPISYRFFTAESLPQPFSIEAKSSLSSLARNSLVSGVDPSLLFGSVPVSSRPKIVSNVSFLMNQSGSASYKTSQGTPIIISKPPTAQFTNFQQQYALSNYIKVYFDVKQSEILGSELSKTVRFEVSALDSESSPISFSQKIQITLPGESLTLKDPNIATSSADILRRRIVSFDTPDLVSYEVAESSISGSNEPYVVRKVGYVTSDSTVSISSQPDIESRMVINPDKIVTSQAVSTSFPFYIANGEQQDTWKITFERLPQYVEAIRISLRTPSQPSYLRKLHQIIRTQGEKSFFVTTDGLASGQDYIVNITFDDSRVGKIEASNEILWTYKKKSGWASLNSITVSKVSVFDDVTRTFVSQANIKANVVDDNTAWSDFNNSLAQSGVSIEGTSATNRFAKVFRAQSIDLFTGEQQFLAEGLPLDSFRGSGVNLRLPSVNPQVIIIDVGIIDNLGVYFAGSTSQNSLSSAESYAFFTRVASPAGNFGLSFSKYYTGISISVLDASSLLYGVTSFTIDQTRMPEYDVLQWSINSSNTISSPVDHFQIIATVDGASYLLGCVPFRPSSLNYQYIERNLSGIVGRVSYTINPILTNMRSSSSSTLSKFIDSGLVGINMASILSQGIVDENYEQSIKPNVALERIVNAIQ